MSLSILISTAFSSTLRIYKPTELLRGTNYRNGYNSSCTAHPSCESHYGQKDTQAVLAGSQLRLAGGQQGISGDRTAECVHAAFRASAVLKELFSFDAALHGFKPGRDPQQTSQAASRRPCAEQGRELPAV